MKKSSIFISISFLAVVLFSCGKSNEKTHEPSHDSATIELNEGEKWSLPDTMRHYLRAMEADIVNFDASDSAAFDKLASSLDANLDGLTSNCTMKGKGHDELHKWLVPYMNLVEKMTESDNEADSKSIFTEMESSFKTFNTYFE